MDAVDMTPALCNMTYDNAYPLAMYIVHSRHRRGDGDSFY
jgi:hypothetical protein